MLIRWACFASRREMDGDLAGGRTRNERLLGRHLQLIADVPIGIFETTREGTHPPRQSPAPVDPGPGLPRNPAWPSSHAFRPGASCLPADRKRRLGAPGEPQGELRGFETIYTRPDGEVVNLVINAHLKSNGYERSRHRRGNGRDAVSERKAGRPRARIRPPTAGRRLAPGRDGGSRHRGAAQRRQCPDQRESDRARRAGPPASRAGSATSGASWACCRWRNTACPQYSRTAMSGTRSARFPATPRPASRKRKQQDPRRRRNPGRSFRAYPRDHRHAAELRPASSG